MGNRNVRGSCEINTYYSINIRVEGIWGRGMLKVKVVVTMRMVAGRSHGCGKQCGQ